MRGLELARAYYEQFGRPMLEAQFPGLLPHIAVGLFGSGSECFGYDDDISRDHDFEPGFMLLLPGEDVVSRREAFLLERAYAKLPREFQGLRRGLMQPVGGARHGVIRTADFFREKVGVSDGMLTVGQWLLVPEYALAEAVNGAVFFDGPREVTAIRRYLSAWPEDIRKKKLAGRLLLMAQAGQYNYPRCLRHGEKGAAQLAAIEFARNCMSAVFLLNGVYQPYYKWAFRAMRELPRLYGDMAADKARVIEGMAADVIAELQRQGLTQANCGDLEKHAYSVNDSIADGDIRNLHILEAV